MLRRRRLAAGVKTGSAVQCESTEAQKGLGILGRALGSGSGQCEQRAGAGRQAGRRAGQLPCHYIPNVRYRIVCTSLHLTSPFLSASTSEMVRVGGGMIQLAHQDQQAAVDTARPRSMLGPTRETQV